MRDELEVEEVLRRLGGSAHFSVLTAHATRGAVASALRSRRIVRARRGVYALPTLDPASAAARMLTGSVSHLSAALAHGWAVKRIPDRPQVTVPANRNLDVEAWPWIEVFRGTVRAEGMVTTAVQTVLDCARRLPFDEGLTVADSALRSGTVTREQLREAATASSRKGRSLALRVIEQADGRADNPFESVVRAVALGVPGLRLVPQVSLGDLGRPDLYDENLALVVECDSFGFHSTRGALLHDIERYNAFALEGLRLLRFGYEHAMANAAYVDRCLRAAVTAGRRVIRPQSRPKAS